MYIVKKYIQKKSPDFDKKYTLIILYYYPLFKFENR